MLSYAAGSVGGGGGWCPSHLPRNGHHSQEGSFLGLHWAVEAHTEIDEWKDPAGLAQGWEHRGQELSRWPSPMAPLSASLWVLGKAPEMQRGFAPVEKKKATGFNMTHRRTFSTPDPVSPTGGDGQCQHGSQKKKNQIAAWKACPWERELGHTRTAGGS